MAAGYDVIVVGLGAMGSAALRHLAGRGAHVLGLEMFVPGHDRGSSHGEHRMFRRSSFTDDGYVPLGERALALWAELEAESGRDLLRETGEIWLLDGASHPDLLPGLDSMVRRGFRQLLSKADLVERFPGVRPPEGAVVAWEAGAGFVRSEAGILAHLNVAARHGATIRTNEEVLGWSAGAGGVTVKTRAGRFTADRLVVTTGPWAGELLADLELPLRVERTVNGFFRPKRLDRWSADAGAPTFLLDVPEGSFYGIPAVDGIGLKIGLSGGGGRAVTTARAIRREIDDAEIDLVRGVLDRYLPGASGPELRRMTCMCTYTPDRGFVVDRHPTHGNVVVGCGFSGRGYKFAPVVGEILADLALDGRTRHDIPFLSAQRFAAASEPAGALP